MNTETKNKLIEIIKHHCFASKKIATELDLKLIGASPEVIKLVGTTIDILEENLLAEIDII